MENAQQQIVFVCEHGAAKSIIAAAYLNQLAAAQNMNLRAIVRGTQPDAAIAPNAAGGLAADGLLPFDEKPQKVSQDEVATAAHVIAFGALDLPDHIPTQVMQWDDVPPVSASYEQARDAIVAHLTALLNEVGEHSIF